LLPFLRLDGYYIVADLVGVPDLFARIKPVMRSLLPWRRTEDSVRELKGWVRAAVTLWVAATVVFLLYAYVMLIVHLPQILATAWTSLGGLASSTGGAAGGGRWGEACLDGLQVLLLALPIAGVGILLWKTGARGVRLVARTRGHPMLQAALALAGAAAIALIVVAVGPRGHYQPISPTDRGTIQGGLGSLANTYIAPNAQQGSASQATSAGGQGTTSTGTTTQPGTSGGQQPAPTAVSGATATAQPTLSTTPTAGATGTPAPSATP
ncbi:MAG: hypothetical protein ABR498_01100, partial [Candidatus Dormibacteria bacterium]